jgi:hypothetical protein
VDGPAWAWENHLHVNRPPNDFHAFAFCPSPKPDAPTKALSRHKFIEVINKAVRAANLDVIQAHGLQIGGTLKYLLRGLTFETVKAKGRWSSDAFAIYLQQHAQVLAPHMQARPELHQQLLQMVQPATAQNSKHTPILS